ncbi:MAG: NAD(P)/FAD-dependent oxidoreductase [Trichloromonas sp.]|jgi:NADH dehydrogenase|nr:NAD(P)/FAD-dependent oxidoreductase [Trichloromonas sp.]
MDKPDIVHPHRPRVVIIGGGFAGINAAKALDGAPVSVLVADRRNYHLFQPLLYQVATAVLSPADIASPIRSILKDQANAEVRLAELTDIDLDRHEVRFNNGSAHYDYLILATGATHSYFGKDDWESIAPGLKTIDDALEIRRRILLAFEEAEFEADEETRRGDLTFVVVGGGPTGVELAGALIEIAARTIPHDFRYIDTATARVILVEAADRLLQAMPEEMSRRAERELTEMGVEVRLNSLVTGMEDGAVYIGDQRLAAANVIWAAGVQGSPTARRLKTDLDRAGRVKVAPDLSVPGHPEIFVVGDLAHAVDPATGAQVPGAAPAAKQMGEFVAGVIRREITGEITPPTRPVFAYHDKGTMATIGRFKAVAAVGKRKFTGTFAWLLWSLIHIFFLVGFRRRVFVMFSWIWHYASFHKGARLITGSPRIRIKSPRPDDD